MSAELVVLPILSSPSPSKESKEEKAEMKAGEEKVEAKESKEKKEEKVRKRRIKELSDEDEANIAKSHKVDSKANDKANDAEVVDLTTTDLSDRTDSVVNEFAIESLTEIRRRLGKAIDNRHSGYIERFLDWIEEYKKIIGETMKMMELPMSEYKPRIPDESEGLDLEAARTELIDMMNGMIMQQDGKSSFSRQSPSGWQCVRNILYWIQLHRMNGYYRVMMSEDKTAASIEVVNSGFDSRDGGFDSKDGGFEDKSRMWKFFACNPKRLERFFELLSGVIPPNFVYESIQFQRAIKEF